MLLSQRNILKIGRPAALVAASEIGKEDGLWGMYRIDDAVHALARRFPETIREQLEAEYLEGYQEGMTELPF